MKISQLLADVPCGCPLSAQYVWLIAFRGMHRNVQLRAVSECEGGFFCAVASEGECVVLRRRRKVDLTPSAPFTQILFGANTRV